MASLKEIGEEGLWEQVNPKAITSNELYGIMSKTKEWKDGAIAVIMRNMAKELNGRHDFSRFLRKFEKKIDFLPRILDIGYSHRNDVFLYRVYNVIYIL